MRNKKLAISRFTTAMVLLLTTATFYGQDKSVAPGINKPFQKPDVGEFQGKFEKEGREAFDHRDKIVEACQVRAGMAVADVGAGTGLFTRLFVPLVGEKGRVFAVDISQDFVDHIVIAARKGNLKNIEGVVCKPDSVGLPEMSVDLVFICDTYHHFEFPHKTMQSIHKALKPGGRVVLVDYQRIAGKSTDWVMNHVRAGQEVVEKEITECGFKRVAEVKDLLKENYLVVFEKTESSKP
ncbi:Ubiquinone/menaquinone biosynthesis C-methyltransferase UbiE [Anatilimnocola aggregata]|uniref:Ubiquinone/menaquinone biosynthesis C-methyltransferase UbiE n=1 Tax=Anatilimnocola aggregata TaxID=2528021 RepID=A0A517YE70_9BACT|nr:methyltransferase domain-containing protein [Anatilimnocola aggregata]QDU28526.1 Ubiquinone/menaquinone biosynthesis C-methyltransferase UbiE [Anatilimnocola aggregata]